MSEKRESERERVRERETRRVKSEERREKREEKRREKRQREGTQCGIEIAIGMLATTWGLVGKHAVPRAADD